MDSSALYTVAGGLKPMTSNFLPSLGRGGALGFARGEFRPDSPIARQADELRQLMRVLRCGDDIQSAVLTDVDMFTADGRSVAEPFVFHTSAVRHIIGALPDYFAALGLTSHTTPETLLLTMQRAVGRSPDSTTAERQAWMRSHLDLTSPRTRALGLLYGYPRAAVDAYVEGVEQVVRGERRPDAAGDVGAFVMTIPNYRGEAVWYRQATVEDGPEDKALRMKAAEILAEYRKRREKFIGPGKPGIVALLRDWLCAGNACAVPTVAQ